MSELHPLPPDKADRDLVKALKGYHRLRWAALGVLGTVLALSICAVWAVIVHQSDQIAQQQQQIARQQNEITVACGFFTDLASLPVTPAPTVKRPTRLGVSIVADSRATAKAFGCPVIPPPTDSLRKWAAYYHIPLR